MSHRLGEPNRRISTGPRCLSQDTCWAYKEHTEVLDAVLPVDVVQGQHLGTAPGPAGDRHNGRNRADGARTTRPQLQRPALRGAEGQLPRCGPATDPRPWSLSHSGTDAPGSHNAGTSDIRQKRSIQKTTVTPFPRRLSSIDHLSAYHRLVA
jgi:hypothetical protein